MIITTKFKYQDTVWFMNNNAVNNGKVIKVSTFSAFADPTRIFYGVSYPGNFMELIESKLFSTKEELIASL